MILSSDDRAALINRISQLEHIKGRKKKHPNKKTFAFVVAAVEEEWPMSFTNRLSFEFQLPKANSLDLKTIEGNSKDWELAFQEDLLKALKFRKKNDERECIKSLLIDELSASPSPLFFYCLLRPEIYPNLEYIQAIVHCWESLELPHSQNRHFLLLIYGTKNKGFLGWREKQVEKWRNTLQQKLARNYHDEVVVPRLKSPSKEDINHWLETQLRGREQEQDDFKEAIKKIKTAPHEWLRATYRKIAKLQNQEHKIP
jgi:hypothetical protein